MSNVVMDVITFPENLLTTTGLSILLHGVISLPTQHHMIKAFTPINIPKI